MDQLTYMGYLSCVVNEFDCIIVVRDNFQILYFQGSLRPSIFAKLDERYRNLDDWQEIVKETVNAKAKIAWQTNLLVWENHARCPRSHRILKYKKS